MFSISVVVKFPQSPAHWGLSETAMHWNVWREETFATCFIAQSPKLSTQKISAQKTYKIEYFVGIYEAQEICNSGITKIILY